MSAKSRDVWRLNNPMKHAYNSLKSNAKARGKDFDLTFDQFKKFAVKTDYMNMRGRTGQAYHIDRIHEEEGYTEGNLQTLKNVDNIKKYVAFKYRDRDGAHFETKIQQPLNGADYPF